MNIANSYVRIFCTYINFWHLVYMWIIYTTWYSNFYNIILNNNMIKTVNVYISTAWYLLYQIHIRWYNINIQHDMLDYFYFINILITNCKKDICLKYMLEYCVYVTRLLNSVFLKLISTIKCNFTTRKIQFQKKKCQVAYPTFILSYLVNILNFSIWCRYRLYS